MTALDFLLVAKLCAVRRRNVVRGRLSKKDCVAERTCLDVSGIVRQVMLAEQLPHRGGVRSILKTLSLATRSSDNL